MHLNSEDYYRDLILFDKKKNYEKSPRAYWFSQLLYLNSSAFGKF